MGRELVGSLAQHAASTLTGNCLLPRRCLCLPRRSVQTRAAGEAKVDYPEHFTVTKLCISLGGQREVEIPVHGRTESMPAALLLMWAMPVQGKP